MNDIKPKERPILFSAPMVRALMAGTKTQTRRPVKGFALKWLTMHDGFNAEFVALPENHKSPFGYVDDRLWVREAWARDDEDGQILYRADDNEETRNWDQLRAEFGLAKYNWKPSIHMPRAVSRLSLQITGVHIERLQDISEQDAIAEGVRPLAGSDGPNYWTVDAGGIHLNHPTAVGAYSMLWEWINGEDSWASNPWVWVVEFKHPETATPSFNQDAAWRDALGDKP